MSTTKNQKARNDSAATKVDAVRNERPIIFGASSIQAILSGRKSQTRRVIKPQPEYRDVAGAFASWAFKVRDNHWLLYPNAADQVLALCPYGKLGDRLWVRETFCWKFIDPPGPNGYYDGYWYAATDNTPMAVDGDGGQRLRKNGEEASPWISGLRMPREASRITLEITEVRVERLREISENDVRAEGIDDAYCAELGMDAHRDPGPIEAWCHGWDALNAKRGYSWESNCWVWVLTFQRSDRKEN